MLRDERRGQAECRLWCCFVKVRKDRGIASAVWGSCHWGSMWGMLKLT